MARHISATLAIAAALFAAAPALASTAAALRSADPLPTVFVRFFYQWKSQPRDLQVSDLKVLDAGPGLRVLCGAYALPGQAQRPFLVLGDATPAAQAAWEPGSFPETDPLYPQLMGNLRLCQRLGAAVTASQWGETAPQAGRPEA
jgi:hypothetical protein